jgi:hypothetical protein
MMKPTSHFAVGAGCLALTFLSGTIASATDIYNNQADSITSTNSLPQLGRISRNSVQQTWDPATSGETAYPGAINTTTTYNYTTVTFLPTQLGDLTADAYIQIDISEPNAADLFASAWSGLYTGTASVQSGTDWLGDAGQSEDYAFTSIPPTPQDPRFFNVTLTPGESLTVVVNTTATAALGEAFGLRVEDFSSTDYTDMVPEPSTWAMLGVGLVLGGVAVARRRSVA